LVPAFLPMIEIMGLFFGLVILLREGAGGKSASHTC